MNPDLPDSRTLMLSAILFEGGMGVVACGIGLGIGFPVWEEVVWNEVDALWGIAACLPMLAGFAICLRWPVGPIASIKRFSDEVIVPMFRQCTILQLSLISLLAGVGEELFFRGLLQTRFARWWGEPPGLIVASAVFGLLHPFTASYVVLAALIGLYLGWAYQLTGNLLVPMLAHGLYDFVALLVLARIGKDAAGTRRWF